MSSEDWMPNLPLACQTVLDLLPACEQALQKSLKEISAESKWMNEIIDKNWRFFPGKSSGDAVKINTASVRTSDRPQCMDVNSKTSCTESNQKSKKVTQKSRNPVCDNKPLVCKQPLTCSSVQKDSKENQPPVRQLSDENKCRNSSRVVTKNKPYIPTGSKKVFEEKGADKRLCTSAHVVKHTINKSVQRQDSTAGKILVASTLNSAGRKDCNSKMSCEQKSSGCRTINHLQIKEPSWRNSTLKNAQLGKGKPLANTCEPQQVVNVEGNSHASRWNQTNQLQREHRRDMHASTTSKGMAAIFNGIKNTHLQNQSLNETITVVTEVFELTGNGQPARLKEYEVFKTKSAPVERVVMPESIFMCTDSYSDPPSASSDQGFNDDDDCDQSVTASSEKSVAFSRKNSSNQSDGIDAEVKAVTLTQSLSDQKINGPLSTVTKPSKDSGIEAEQIKSAFGDKFTGRWKEFQGRTTAQKELANKKTVAEVAKTITRLGQRQNLNENFSKTTSSNKPAAEEKALIPKPKYCSSLDRNSMALQKQKQQLLTVKTRAQESLRKAAEMRTQKMEEQKKLREEKKAKDAVVKEFETVSDHEGKTRINKRSETQLIVKEKVLEERCRDEQDKQKQSNLQPETEANKKEGFRTEREQVLEQEGKNRVQEVLTGRNEKHLTTEQNTHGLEGKSVDFKEQLKEDKLRMKQEKEAKDREREQRRIEKEKHIAFERAEQLRIDREKKEEREKKIKEEYEKLKAMERERLQHKQKIQFQQPQKTQPTKLSSEHKKSLIQKPTRASIAKTAAALGNVNNSNLNSYVMTPVKKISISSKPSDADNYGLEDKCSDESTDDEEDPKKKIPEWATGVALNTALITQFFKPPDLEEIFHMSRIEPPNLTLVFPGRRKLRYNYRTSSANWNSPPLKQH